MEERKEILFQPSQTQLKFLEAVFSGKYRYLLFGGSIRGGKTYAVLGTLMLLCKMYPGSRWVIVRDSLTTLKRNLIPSFFKICPNSFVKNYNQDTQTVTLSNGSTIVFFSENFDEDKLLLRWRGLECNGFILEECNELQEESFYKAIERAGTWVLPGGLAKPKPIIMLTCNPSKNWVKTRFYDRHVNNTLPDDWCYIPSKITDNPFIMEDADYLESLKNMPTYEYQTFVEGNWELLEKTENAAYKCFDVNKHVGVYNYNPTSKLYLSFDDNVSPYLPCGAFQVALVREGDKQINEVRMIDCILGKHPFNTVESICKMIKEKYPPSQHLATVEVYGDATAQKQDTKIEKGSNFFSLVMGCLRQYKISNRVSASNESVSMRLSWINSVLEKETDNIRFRIDNKCKEAISDFIQTREAADGTKLKNLVTDPKTKVRYQEHGHITDLLEYFLTGLFASEYHKYKRGGNRSFGITLVKRLPSKNSY